MTKAIIFDTELHAKQADWDSNSLTGSITKYKYNRKLLQATTTLTKAEYAALLGIPATLTDEEGETIGNPAYTALDDSYTLHKCALVVGNTHDVYDPETDTYSTPDYVVDVSEMLLESGDDV